MSLAAETRRAAESSPFLVAALRAGIVNYTAAARFLAVDGETDAIATALRRYAEELPDYSERGHETRVRMESGIGPLEGDDGDSERTAGINPLLAVGGSAFGATGSDQTAIIATGDVGPAALGAVLQRLSLTDVSPTAAAVGDDTLLVIVGRREGATTLRTVEGALESVPESPSQ